MQSLSDLLLDFKRCYAECWHVMVKVYIGLPFPNDAYSQHQIKWRVARVRTDCLEDYGLPASPSRPGPDGGVPSPSRATSLASLAAWNSSAGVINRFAKNAATLADLYRVGIPLL